MSTCSEVGSSYWSSGRKARSGYVSPSPKPPTTGPSPAAPNAEPRQRSLSFALPCPACCPAPRSSPEQKGDQSYGDIRQTQVTSDIRILKSKSHLLFVPAAVDLSLQRFHAFEGLFVVDAVDEDEAVGETEIVAWELVTFPKPPCVIKANLLTSATVRLHRAHVNIFQGLNGLWTCTQEVIVNYRIWYLVYILYIYIYALYCSPATWFP